MLSHGLFRHEDSSPESIAHRFKVLLCAYNNRPGLQNALFQFLDQHLPTLFDLVYEDSELNTLLQHDSLECYWARLLNDDELLAEALNFDLSLTLQAQPKISNLSLIKGFYYVILAKLCQAQATTDEEKQLVDQYYQDALAENNFQAMQYANKQLVGLLVEHNHNKTFNANTESVMQQLLQLGKKLSQLHATPGYVEYAKSCFLISCYHFDVTQNLALAQTASMLALENLIIAQQLAPNAQAEILNAYQSTQATVNIGILGGTVPIDQAIGALTELYGRNQLLSAEDIRCCRMRAEAIAQSERSVSIQQRPITT